MNTLGSLGNEKQDIEEKNEHYLLDDNLWHGHTTIHDGTNGDETNHNELLVLATFYTTKNLPIHPHRRIPNPFPWYKEWC